MQSQSRLSESAYSSYHTPNSDRLAAILQEMEYINTIGKSFVAAIDRFQVHRALLGALQKLYSFAACSILLKGDPFELSIIPCYPLSQVFIAAMIERIASAASVIDFPAVSVEELANASYLDAPDDLSITQKLGSPVQDMIGETALWRQAEIGRQRLELIISSMAEGLLITNEQGGITLLNVSAQHLLAQAQLDLKQNSPLRTLALANNVSWLHKLADIIDEALTGVTVMNQELIAGEAGEPVPLTLSISAAPLHDASQVQMGPIGVVAVLNDVTANKQIEKLKDEFVSVVSHELRSPLTAIKGYTQHLMRRIDRRLRKTQQEQQSSAISGVDLPENYDLRSLSIIQSQADHLERLVNDLLDLSQVQWGKLHLQYSSFYLADVLVESVRSVQASTEQHTIYLDIAVQDTKIVADKMRMSQVIGNILDNAIKYSPQGGQVTVKLEEREGDYFVSITDQGIGISQEYLDHIFERFYRVRNTASRQYSGIGLGLYVTRAIVEEHGGHIWVTNNKGLGCTFSFTVPAAAHSD